MVAQRLENAKNRIIQGQRNDEEIHGGAIVEFHQQVNIVRAEKDSDNISDGIKSFFSGNIVKGLEDIIELGAEVVLNNSSAGEFEETDMFIVWNSNALLRCDAYYYRWNFSVSGVIEECEGASGVLLVKRVIDLTKTDPQVLTWAITEQMMGRGPAVDGVEKEIEKEIDDAINVLKKVVSLQVELKQIEAGKVE